METLKTTYATAYNRLLLLLKSGIIGKVVSVDTTCTSLCDITDANYIKTGWPKWKTDYFEIRFEDQEKNKRYFYPLEGEGIRYELIAFLRAIVTRKSQGYISQELSKGIVQVIEDYYNHNDMMLLDEIIK